MADVTDDNRRVNVHEVLPAGRRTCVVFFGGVNAHRRASSVHFCDHPPILYLGREAGHCVSISLCFDQLAATGSLCSDKTARQARSNKTS